MPKILQINVTVNWGSTGKIAEQIGQSVLSQNWESYVVYGRMSNPSRSKLLKIGNVVDVYEHYIENLFLDNEGLASRRATRNLLREIDKISPDIIHLHNIHDHYLNYRYLFRYLIEKRIPVVWTQHDQWAATGHCMYTPIDCEKWKRECSDCPLSSWFSIDNSRRNYQLKKNLISAVPSLTIVAVSNWLAEKMRESHLKNLPIHVIHNGIDINLFSPKPSNICEKLGVDSSKSIILGVAAVWDERKGLNDFIRLSTILPADDYVIVIIGRVASKTKAPYGACKMIFCDQTQNVNELAQLYSAAFVFVNPTYQDNYPTTNLESLACGTPVVTYRTGGSPEAVDEKTGVVVDQGDVEALAEAILSLKTRPLSREDCRKRAEMYFDKAVCFNEYIELYESLLSK